MENADFIDKANAAAYEHLMSKSKTNQQVKPQEGTWSGRFAKGMDPLALEFNASVSFDQKLYRSDIIGSLVHAKMLHRVGILSGADHKKIVRGLTSILNDIEFPSQDLPVLELSPYLTTGPVQNAVSIASYPRWRILFFRCSCSVLSATTVQDGSVAKTGLAWVLKPLPASHHVASLILVSQQR